MLILSRKINEKIMIGDNISISIIGIKGDQIRIGVDAPRSVKVFRQEVLSEIKAANKAASESGTAPPVLPNLSTLEPSDVRSERKKNHLRQA
jgi:carbon storage regulator